MLEPSTQSVETNMEDRKSENIYESLNASTVSSDNISSSIDEKQNLIEDHSEAWEKNSGTPEVTIELTAAEEDTDETVSASSYEKIDGENKTINDFLDETETIAPELGENEEMFQTLLTRATAQATRTVMFLFNHVFLELGGFGGIGRVRRPASSIAFARKP